MGNEDCASEGVTTRNRTWFPFSVTECEVALGVIGILVAGLAAFGVNEREFAVSVLGLVLAVYVLGLLAYGMRRARRYRFVKDGGLQGLGYLPYLRRARQSLFVTHADDDVPAVELLGLYDRLLARGVSIRRLIFQRPGHPVDDLVRCFGAHENLRQRIVPTPVAASMPLSFAVVDERVVILSLPGASSIDSTNYSLQFLLRHLLVLADASVAKVFLRIHERLWGLGKVLPGDGAPSS